MTKEEDEEKRYPDEQPQKKWSEKAKEKYEAVKEYAKKAGDTTIGETKEKIERVFVKPKPPSEVKSEEEVSEAKQRAAIKRAEDIEYQRKSKREEHEYNLRARKQAFEEAKWRAKHAPVRSELGGVSGMAQSGLQNMAPSHIDPFAAFNNAMSGRHDMRGRPGKPTDPMGAMNRMLGLSGPQQAQAPKQKYMVQTQKVPYRDQGGKMRYHTLSTKIPIEETTTAPTQPVRRDPLDFGFGGANQGQFRNPLDMFNQASGVAPRRRDPLDFR
jgi:hypothetical protein